MKSSASKLLVGAFGSREDADAAQRELASRDWGRRARDEDERAHRPDDPTILREGGVADLIENMFRRPGGERSQADRYGAAARAGQWIVAVRGVPADRIEEARALLAEHGRVEAHDVPGSPERASAEVVVFGPNAASLPNSPSDWFEPRMASTIPGASDPLRPRGLIEGAHTLDPENLDEALPRPQPGDTKPTSSRWRR